MNKRTTTDQWKRIDEIFQAVVDLPAAEQRQKLEELAGHDQGLFGEVQSLLAFDNNKDSNLPALLRNQTPIEARQNIGDSVGNYRLLYPIAVGSLSEVWCAEPSAVANVSDRRVAIKFLRTKQGPENQQRHFMRFAKEAHLLNRFRHPNIAELIEVGQTSEKSPFIVMRFVSGKPITEFADSQRMTLNERAKLMLQVCDAVEYAHRFLVVHRDLKPSNILVESSCEPFILDFGISKDLSNNDESSKSLTLTSAEERPMTPAYASPEQVRGEAISTATDVHGLGLLLFEIMSGHHPFSKTCHPTTPQLFDRVCSSVPRAPSEVVNETTVALESDPDEKPNTGQMIAALRNATSGSLKRQLKRGLDNVILKAISKSPEKRYPSVADLRNDLINVIENRPVSARVARPGITTAVRKHPLRWLGMSAATVALLTMGVMSYYGNERTKLERGELAKAKAASAQLELDLEAATEEADEAQSRFQELESSVAEALGRSGEEFANANVAGQAVSPAITAALARKAAENEDFDSARSLLNIEAVEEFSLGARIDLAMTYQILGRPSRGLHLLKDVSTDQLDRESILALTDRPTDLQHAMMRLLLDAGRMSDASKWWEFDLGGNNKNEQSASRMLMMAEARAGIGWIDGTEQLLSQFGSKSIELTASESMYRDYVANMINEEPDEFISFAEKNPKQHAAQMICVRAMIQESQLRRNTKQYDASKNLLDKAQNLLNDSRMPDHFYSLLILEERSELAKAIGDSESREELNDRYWARAIESEELGVVASIWQAVGRMESAKDRSEIEQVLKAVEPFAATYQSDPHLKRWIMIHQFQLDIDDQEWQNAQKHLEQLCEIEPMLWETYSLQNAYAMSARAFVSAQLDSPMASDNWLDLMPVLRKLADDNSAIPVSIFLRTAIEDGNLDLDGVPLHGWVRMFMMHSRNPVKDQLEMVAFHIDSPERTNGDDKKNLISNSADFLEKNASEETKAFTTRVGNIVERSDVATEEKERWKKLKASL